METATGNIRKPFKSTLIRNEEEIGDKYFAKRLIIYIPWVSNDNLSNLILSEEPLLICCALFFTLILGYTANFFKREKGGGARIFMYPFVHIVSILLINTLCKKNVYCVYNYTFVGVYTV